MVTNTIDGTIPTSSVDPLTGNRTAQLHCELVRPGHAAARASPHTTFTNRSTAVFTLWQTNTTATSAVFTGTVGDTYAFYSVATSNVAAVQPAPTPITAQASTKVEPAVFNQAASMALTSSAAPAAYGQAVTFTATLSAMAPGDGTPTGRSPSKMAARSWARGPSMPAVRPASTPRR